MSDATGVAEALLGLPGFRVLDVHESAAELVIEIETTAEQAGCPGCGVVARAHERMAVLGHVDMIAERATALGGLALGTARLTASSSSLEEYPLDAVADHDTITVIADRPAAFGNAVRAEIDRASGLGDQDTADLFTEVSRAIDKHLWFVEAHLQK